MCMRMRTPMRVRDGCSSLYLTFTYPTISSPPLNTRTEGGFKPQLIDGSRPQETTMRHLLNDITLQTPTIIANLATEPVL